jgi:DNA ligase-4
MFFIMEDREEEITANVDKFSDSYARDTTADELKDV